MANSRFYQFLYSKIPMLTMIQGQINIGASGAVSSSSGNGVYAVTRLAAGIYQVQLQDNYNALISYDAKAISGLSGTSVSAGSFVTGVLYSITAVGSTSWSAIGLNSGLTAAIGQTFVATGVGSGTGTAQAVIPSLVDKVEMPYNPQVMLQNSNALSGQGGLLQLESYALTAAAFTGDTHTNTTVDNISSMAGIAVGQAISGAGIPLGATVATIAGATSITISAAATATTATVPMTAGPAKILSNPASGSSIIFSFFLRNSSNTY